MTFKCTACAEYEPPNCKCSCHELMRYASRVKDVEEAFGVDG